MAVTFRLQWPVFLLVYYFLASTATEQWRQERRNTNRHRRTTTLTEDMSELDFTESSSKLNLTALTTPATPVVFTVLKGGERTRQGNGVNVTRKNFHNKPKSRKNSTQDVHTTAVNSVYSQITPNSVPKPLSVIKEHAVLTTVSPRLSEIATPRALGQVNTVGAKSNITRQLPETSDSWHRTVAAHPKYQRVKSTSLSTTLPTPTKPVQETIREYGHTTTDGHRIIPSFSKFNERGSKVSYVKDNSSTCHSSCELRNCLPVEAEMCKGRVVKDHCNCCPVCLVEQMPNDPKDEVGARKTSYYASNACDGMVCERNKVCILNIQGIPMCRCPNVYSCRNLDKNPLCAQNGVTYKNKCFLKAEECTLGRRLQVSHKGACRSFQVTTDSNAFPSTKSWVQRTPVNAASYFYTRILETTQRKGGKHVIDPWKHSAAKEKGKSAERRPRKRSGGI